MKRPAAKATKVKKPVVKKKATAARISWLKLVPSEDPKYKPRSESAAGIHHRGDIGDTCCASGADDYVTLDADLDFGTFQVPKVTKGGNRTTRKKIAEGQGRRLGFGFRDGNPGKEIHQQSASVKEMSVDQALRRLMEFMEVTPETLDQRCRYPESNDLGEILYGVDDVCNEYSCKATEIEDELLEFFESKNQMNKMNQHNRNCKRLYRAIVHEACNEKRNGHVWGEENPKATMEKLKKERNAAKNIEMRKKIQGRINRLKKDWEKDLEDDEDDDVTFDRRQKEPRNDSRIKKCHVLVIYFLKDGPKACARVTLSKHLHRTISILDPWTGRQYDC